MRIQLLHVPDCPLAAGVRSTLQECLRHTGAAAAIEEHVGDYPSPTVLVDGIDVVTGRPPGRDACCRFDPPTHAQIHAALARNRPMSKPRITALKEAWRCRDHSTNPVGRVGIELLADGKPVTAAKLAGAMGVGVEQAKTYIDKAGRVGVEVENGAVVGAALTLRPTGHRFRVRGNDLYTWCGFDALFLPIMLGERAEVVSTCPITGIEVRLTVEPDGLVSSAVPHTVVVGIVGQDVASSCSVAGPGSGICTQMPFFAFRDAGERWLIDHPGVAVVDLDEAREIAHVYVQKA